MLDIEAKKKKDRIHEIVSYSIVGTFWLGGLAICILGVYAFNGPGKVANNDIFQAQKNFTKWLGWSRMVDFRVLGALICLLSMAVFLAFVNKYANRYEKDEIRKAAQIERLKELVAQDKKKQEELAQANAANSQVPPAPSQNGPKAE
jgi:Ni,Fe-hydrogenase I cytochrome b subunit